MTALVHRLTVVRVSEIIRMLVIVSEWSHHALEWP